MLETRSPSLVADAQTPATEARFTTSSGIEIKRLYGPDDVVAADWLTTKPGESPFVRGIHPEGYRKKLWTMRMYCGYGTPKETNKRFKYLISQGETGLSLAFDLPTQIGYDPDDPKAKGEVGKVGVSVSGFWDFERLMEGIDLKEVSLSMTINSTAFILYAFFYVLAEKRGLDPKMLRGTLQNDPLKEFIARGTYAYPPGPSLRLCADLVDFSLQHTPQVYPISISGYHIREAGATAVDELAFTLADATVYLDTLKARGHDLKSILPRLSFFFGVHNHMLEEIAKFRAARLLWARLLKERYGIVDASLAKLRFHAQTCGSTLTR
ncbi:MAG: methylmalonyl-CoA mutase family protein, partial [Elusimicrobiota bacterium]